MAREKIVGRYSHGRVSQLANETAILLGRHRGPFLRCFESHVLLEKVASAREGSRVQCYPGIFQSN